MADIEIPISAKMDTKAAEAAIHGLVTSIQNLTKISNSNRSIAPAQVAKLQETYVGKLKTDQKMNKLFGLDNKNDKLDRGTIHTVAKGNTDEISKITIEQLLQTRRHIAESIERNPSGKLNQELKFFMVELDRIINTHVSVQLDNAKKFLVGKPNASSYLSQVNPGRPANAPIPVQKALTDFSKISPEVMPGINDRVSAIQSIINTGGGEEEAMKVNAMLDDLFNDVDKAILNYVRGVKSKIEANLLENSMQSRDFLQSRLNAPGTRSAVIEAAQTQSQRRDLTQDQRVALKTNLDAIIEAEGSSVDSRITQAANAVQQLLNSMGQVATKVEQTAKDESTQTVQSGRSAVSLIKSRRNRNQRTGSEGGGGGGGGGGSYGPAPMSGGGGGGKGLGRAAKSMGDDADDAGRSVNSAFRALNRVITDASAMLNSTATIAKGSLRVRDKAVDIETFARDLSKGMQDYVTRVNEAFNNIKLPSGRMVPKDILRDTVNESLRSGEVAGFTALPEEQRGLATAARGRAYGQAAGLQGPEAEKFALAYARSVEDLVQQQTKLGEAIAIANLKTIEKNRADIELLIQEGKYEEALKIATNTLVTKTERDAMGNVRVVSEPIGKQTPEDLIKKGYTADAANMAQGAVEDTQRKIKRHQDIVDKPISGLKKLTSFAGQAMTVYGFLAMTIGTVAMKVSELVEKANKLEKASATINALAGNTTKYAEVMAIAVKQQTKFGGSLDESLQGFVSLVPITKKFGLDLEEVDNIARRLAIVDPLQGFSGAAIALKEFLSGDITSLSRRFEIDRKTLNSIKEAGTKAEQLKELDKVLNSMGISQGVLAARTATAAASFDKAGSAWDNYETLLGQGLQEALKPAADMVTDWFGEAAGELATNLQLQNKEQDILGEYAKVIDLSKDILVNMEDVNKPVSELDKFLSSSANSMQSMFYYAKDLKGEMEDIFTRANTAVAELNKNRLAAGAEANIVPFRTPSEALTYTRAGQYLGADRIMASREESAMYNPDDRASIYGAIASAAATVGMNTDVDINSMAQGFWENLIPEGQVESALQQYGKITAGEADVVSALAKQASLVLKGPDGEELAGVAMRGLEGIIKPEDLEGLTEAEKVNKTLLQTLNDLRKGYISAAVAVERFGELLGAQKDTQIVPAFVKELQRIQKVQDDYNTAIKKVGDNDFSTELYNKSLGSINSTVQEINDSYTKQQALIYYNSTMMEAADKTKISNTKAQEILESGLFDIQGEISVERENGARIIAEATILQTRLLLSQEKSVSVIGAMGDNFGKYLVDLESAAKLAVDFNKSMSSLVTGPLMAGMSLQDQLNFGQMQMSGQIPGMQPQNQGDIMSLTGQNLALVTQIEQEKLDIAQRGGKNSDDIKDMHAQFFKDQNKAKADHDKEMKELEEEHLKKMEELRRESETSKRGNEVDFYESLFGMDNLTADQVAQAGAEYQSIKAEATDLRNQGQFEKADAVESAGKAGILSKYGDLEEKAKLMLDIKDADEETAELNKEMGKAKTADDRAEIQRKLDKIAVEKAKYENELAQITALETMKKNLYEADLLNARTLQETETENYKIEVGKRETAFDEAEKERTRKHGEEVAKRKKAEDEAHKAQISNLNEQIALMTFSNSFLDEAYARTLNGAERASALSTIYEVRKTAKDTIMNSSSLAAPTLQTALRQLEAAGPGIVQSTLQSYKTPEADTTAQEVQRDLALKTFNLTTAMDKFTQAVLTGKVVITRGS